VRLSVLSQAAAAPKKEEAKSVGLFDSYEGEPEAAARKPTKAAAAKPAAAAVAPAAAEEENKPIAYQFLIPNDAVEGKTNPQIKAGLSTAFFGWGVIDEIRVVAKEEEKEVTVFFSRPLGKALAAKAKLEKGEAATFAYAAGKEATLAVYEGSSSGGGRASKTDKLPSKKPERGGRGGGRGGASRGSGCFECGQEGHRAADCPGKGAAAGGDAGRGGRGGRGGARGGRGGHSE
jgi:hypothetical protein